MNKYLAFSVFFGLLFVCTFALMQSCGKGGSNSVVIGGWSEVIAPDGCKVKQISYGRYSIALLCEDGRIFH